MSIVSEIFTILSSNSFISGITPSWKSAKTTCFRCHGDSHNAYDYYCKEAVEGDLDDVVEEEYQGYKKRKINEVLEKLNKRNIDVVVHIINGLPYETKEDMLNTVRYLNKLDIQGIKIHMLSILKDTPLEYYYQKEKFHILTKEEYIDITIDQLELLREEIVIHRITGDPKIDDLIEPHWLTKKFCVLNDIDKEMVRRNTYQGIKADELN